MSRLFIIEGPDGAGKSELCTTLNRILTERGYVVEHYRQPGGTVLGEELRRLLLDDDVPADAMAQVFMFYASRRQMLAEAAEHATDKKRVVLTDRFELSSLSYQSAFYKQEMISKHGEEKGLVLHKAFVKKVNLINTVEMEDVDCKYIILDAPDDVLNERRRDGVDRFEKRDLDFKTDVREFYRDWVKKSDTETTMTLDSTYPFCNEYLESVINFILD